MSMQKKAGSMDEQTSTECVLVLVCGLPYPRAPLLALYSLGSRSPVSVANRMYDAHDEWNSPSILAGMACLAPASSLHDVRPNCLTCRACWAMPLPARLQDPPSPKPSVLGPAVHKKHESHYLHDSPSTLRFPRMEEVGNITTDWKRTNASLQGLIDAHLGCLSAFEKCLDQGYAADSTLRKITLAILEQIRRHKKSFTGAKQDHSFTSSSASHLRARHWGTVTLAHTATASGVKCMSLVGWEGEPERPFEFVCKGQAESSMAQEFVGFVATVVCPFAVRRWYSVTSRELTVFPSVRRV